MVLSIFGTIGVFALTILAGVLTSMISTDVERRSHGWATWLIKRAVKRLPPDLRARFEEEWAADLNDQPSPLSKLLFAAGLLVAARRIRFAERRRVASNAFGARDRLKKRLLDLAVTIPTIVFLAPLLIAVAIAIKLESPGPVLFRQQRVGRGNRPIGVLKFRSMSLERTGTRDLDPAGTYDDRVTRVGRIIRITSIDELPQLLNVLSGDMSLVGPRPNAFVELAGDAADREEGGPARLQVKPGITGLADVRGFRGAPHDERHAGADQAYVEGWGLWRDITLLAWTLWIALRANAVHDDSVHEPRDDH